jgi:hypothetical protein
MRKPATSKARKYSVAELTERWPSGPISFPESELPKRRAQLRAPDLLFEQKPNYGSWKGTPTALFRRDGGDMRDVEGFAWSAAKQQWIPGFTEEAYSKAEVVGDAEFHKLFPGVPPFLPPKKTTEQI